jgi:hypothetical protein
MQKQVNTSLDHPDIWESMVHLGIIKKMYSLIDAPPLHKDQIDRDLAVFK